MHHVGTEPTDLVQPLLCSDKHIYQWLYVPCVRQTS